MHFGRRASYATQLQNKWNFGRETELSDVTAKAVIYEAFVEGKLVRLPNTSCAPSMTFILSRSTMISGRGRYGAYRRRSPQHSRNSILFHSSRATAKLGEFLETGSHTRSDITAVSAGRAPAEHSCTPGAPMNWHHGFCGKISLKQKKIAGLYYLQKPQV